MRTGPFSKDGAAADRVHEAADERSEADCGDGECVIGAVDEEGAEAAGGEVEGVDAVAGG